MNDGVDHEEVEEGDKDDEDDDTLELLIVLSSCLIHLHNILFLFAIISICRECLRSMALLLDSTVLTLNF